MRVLITGIAGFIGSHLAERFVAEGHEVAGIDNLETGRRENVPIQAGFAQCDVADRLELYDYANALNPDLVVHCAASYKDPQKWHHDTDTNVTGTINATLVAKHHGAELIYFQTGLPPISSYAITKIAGEHFVRMYGPHWIFRLANVYGPRNVSGPVPAFFKRITEGQPCVVTDTVRDVVYISDLVDCVVRALNEDYGTYDVCSGKDTSILEQWRAVNRALVLSQAEWMEHFDERAIGEPQVVPVLSDDVQPDVKPENGIPGWKPVVELEEGVANAVEWYRKHGLEQTFTHLAVKG